MSYGGSVPPTRRTPWFVRLPALELHAGVATYSHACERGGLGGGGIHGPPGPIPGTAPARLSVDPYVMDDWTPSSLVLQNRRYIMIAHLSGPPRFLQPTTQQASTYVWGSATAITRHAAAHSTCPPRWPTSAISDVTLLEERLYIQTL